MEAPLPKTSRVDTDRNALLSKAIEILNNAMSEEETGNYESALSLYSQGIELLLLLMKDETHEGRKQLYRAKVTEMLGNAEKLKKKLTTTSSISKTELPKEATEIDKEDDHLQMDCEIKISIEGVNCYSILDDTMNLISSGTLQLLQSSITESLQQQKQQQQNSDEPTDFIHFLKLGEFEFPLTKKIPCLRTHRGHYLVPYQSDIFYAFVFPDNIPEQYLNVFENLLDSACVLRRQDVEVPKEAQQVKSEQKELVPQEKKEMGVVVLEKVAAGIDTGAKLTVQGIQSSTQLLSAGISKGGEYLKSKIVPNEEEAQVNPHLQRTIQVASTISPYCLKLSKALIKGLVLIAEEIGSAVAESVAESQLGSKLKGDSRFNGPKTEAAKQVGLQTLQAVGTIWDALETAGRTLLKETSKTTVAVVNHKYGKAASEVTEEGFNAAIDFIETAYNVQQLGVKKIAKRVAKESGKQTAMNYLSPKEERKLIEDKDNVNLLEDVQ